ncbi:MAG: hypothetical protein DRN88_02465 [Candidatus Hydrothermarchaeota archaeon]|nr:MAG: hypothetical protein DRN88_02465 [Candidatus Hydrothermarchaeota archaeon]
MSSKAVISGLVSGTVTFLLFYKLFSLVPEEAPLTFTGLPHTKYPEIMNFSSVVNILMTIILALFFLVALFLVLIDQLKFSRIEEEMQK